MNTIETIEKVDQTLTNLEASFKVFQDNQEKRIQHIYRDCCELTMNREYGIVFSGDI